jgi:hypothetical protein
MQWSEIPRRPSARTLRQFAAGLAVLTAILAWTAWREERQTLAVAIAAVGAIASAAGAVRPATLRLVFVGWMMAAFPIGWLIGHAALALVFYGLVTPLALVERWRGRDRLRRRARGMASYWRSKPPRDVRSYYSQF